MKQKLLFLITIILMITTIFILPVNAETEETPHCPECADGKSHCVLCGDVNHDFNKLEEEKGTLCLTSYLMYDLMYGELFDESIQLGGMSTKSLLLFKSDENTIFANLLSNAELIYHSISILGCIFVFLYFLLELTEEYLQRDGFTYETFARMSIRTLIAFIVIRNGMQLITFGIDLCAELFQTINFQDPTSVGYAFTLETCPYTEYMNLKIPLFNAIGDVLYNLIPFAAITLAKVFLTGTLYVRLIDITVRIMFAPIGMFDIFRNDTQKQGWVYLKKLLASLLQGACIAGVFLAYGYINIHIRNSIGGYLGSIVLGFALISLTKKSQEIARDVVGV